MRLAVKFAFVPVRSLFTDAQTSNQGTVTFNIHLHQVIKHTSSLTYHLQQATTGMVILFVGSQVLGQIVDSLCENCDLYLWRTSVTLVRCILADYNCFFFFHQHREFHLF